MDLRAFFERIGAETTAKIYGFHCADDYSESLDMATALHPQTTLAAKYAREPIEALFGFPLRLRHPNQLGFKDANGSPTIPTRFGTSKASTGSPGYRLDHPSSVIRLREAHWRHV